MRILCALFFVQPFVGWFAFGVPLGGAWLHGYVSAGVAVLLLSLIQQLLQQDESRMSFEQQITALAGRQANVGRLRTWLLSALFVAVFVTCWPAFALGPHTFRIRRARANVGTRLAASAAVALFPFETSVSLWLLLAAAGTTLSALVTGHATVYTTGFLWVLIGAVACKHLATLISPLDAQQRLRQSADPVIFSYVFLTAADLAVLLLAYNGVLNWVPAPVLSLHSLRTIYDELQVFKDVVNAWQHLPAAPSGYALGLSGLLWLLTFANSLLKLFSNHKRTADDQLAIATCSSIVGLTARAAKALEAVEPQNRQQFQQKGYVLAALGSFEDADRHLEEALRQLSIGTPPYTPDHRFMLMWSGISQLSPQPGARLCGEIEHAADRGLTDVALAAIALDARAVGFDASGVAQWMESRGLHDRFPLSFINLLWLADREREVLGMFDALPLPAVGSAHLAWRCTQAFLLPVRPLASADARAAAIEAWAAAVERSFPGDLASAEALHCRLLTLQLGRAAGYLEERLGRPLAAMGKAIQALQAKADADPLLRKMVPPATPAPSSTEAADPVLADANAVPGGR